MTNNTLIHPALKSQVQALELVFYGRKIDGGDQCPYSQPVGENLTYLWGIGSNGFEAGEAAGDSAGGKEGVTSGRPVRWAGLFIFNALPPPDWLLVRRTLFGFAGAGAEAAAGAAGGAGTTGGAWAGAVVIAVWMRCIPALFLLFMLVAATIFAMSAEVGRPPAAPGETVIAGLPPVGCGVDPRCMPSRFDRCGAADGGGAEIIGSGGG
jgi:hypothetical protein